jgi:hypothetical protein
MTGERFSPTSGTHSTGCFHCKPIRYIPKEGFAVILVHQHQTKEKMKTTTMILAAFLSLHVSLLFAGNETDMNNNTPGTITLSITSLMPVTPSEATFEEVNIPGIDFNALAPDTPSEATFEDTVQAISIESLAPKTPGEATFE